MSSILKQFLWYAGYTILPPNISFTAVDKSIYLKNTGLLTNLLASMMNLRCLFVYPDQNNFACYLLLYSDSNALELFIFSSSGKNSPKKDS